MKNNRTMILSLDMNVIVDAMIADQTLAVKYKRVVLPTILELEQILRLAIHRICVNNGHTVSCMLPSDDVYNKYSKYVHLAYDSYYWDTSNSLPDMPCEILFSAMVLHNTALVQLAVGA